MSPRDIKIVREIAITNAKVDVNISCLFVFFMS